MSESAVVKACLEWLLVHGCYVWRNNSGAYKPNQSERYIRFGKTGSADILGVTPTGRFISVECKAKKNTQSAPQKLFETAIKDRGGLYILAYSIDDLEKYKLQITQDYSSNADLTKYLTV